ncbi:MAG: SDR family oxidoreductase [Caulobacteraceae bacterium]|nr:SDR family oxidoreductase [Caulobacteraceae bacterium]
MSSLFDLTGKVAIVTGSTKGIGAGIARRFVEHGAKVVITSRSQADCEATAGALNQELGREATLGQASDLSDRDSLKRLVETAVRRFGGLDILVLNAAKTDVLGTAGQTPAADFLAMLGANVVNNTELALAAHPHLLERGGGSVIFIGSVAGTGASATVSAYSVCKRALMQVVDNLALEWGRQNIRVNAVVPGLTMTEDTRRFWEAPQVNAAFVARIPLGRWVQPDEIAAACLWLATDGGAAVTAQKIVVDGGLTIRGASEPPADFKALTEAAGG